MKKITLTFIILAMVCGGVATMAMTRESMATTSLELKAATDWDKILDDFEKQVDQYVKTVKKMQSGDLSAAIELEKIAKKVEKLADKLEEADDDDELTVAQAKRYLKIYEKMTKVLADY